MKCLPTHPLEALRSCLIHKCCHILSGQDRAGQGSAFIYAIGRHLCSTQTLPMGVIQAGTLVISQVAFISAHMVVGMNSCST